MQLGGQRQVRPAQRRGIEVEPARQPEQLERIDWLDWLDHAHERA
jgi:hypothetical protein